ncbi:MAG: HIT family protein [Deltaproteobacteria bacterium]|nr:HIT family protein [Deltaproteobacteria bacterium]
MDDCIFCKIVANELPSTRVYEDEKLLAFMDINPVAHGHCLLIPKDHYQDIYTIPEDLLRDLIAAAKPLAGAVASGLKADGLNLFQSNGRAAMQLIDHFHMHFLPRWKDDSLKLGSWEARQGDMKTIEEAAAAIKALLDT